MDTFPISPSTRAALRTISPRRSARTLGGVRAFTRCAAGALLLLASTLATPRVQAQAYDAAHQNIHVELFGMGTYAQPNHRDTDNTAPGVVGGTSFGWRFGYVRPGAEVRISYTKSDFMSQRVTSVGPHVAVDLGPFHPYANYLIGFGKANFANAAQNVNNANTSTVTSVGGGLDLGLTRYWALRADYQRQTWDFDAPYFPFHPQMFSVGARYMVHMHTRRGPQ